jgi:hypothetical protein
MWKPSGLQKTKILLESTNFQLPSEIQFSGIAEVTDSPDERNQALGATVGLTQKLYWQKVKKKPLGNIESTHRNRMR